MPLYECVFIARNDVTQQQVEDIANGIAFLIENEEGSVKKREYWGLRNLAYRVKKNRKGHYMLLGIDAKPETIKEIERQFNLNEDVLRFLTLRVEEIDDTPSPTLSRKGDEKERTSNRSVSKASGRFDSGRKHASEDEDASDLVDEEVVVSSIEVEEDREA